jgi:cytochrome c-type biogenesis protein CcmE
MKTRHKRLVFILLGLAGLGVAAGLALNAFQSNLVFFYSPSQVFSGEAPVNKPFRVGGLVELGSVKKDGLKVSFVVTDNVKSIPVRYEGILPDLFREGQGVVAQGRLGADKQFVAEQVLAKHDENYMPPEVEGVLKDAKVKP